MSEEKRRERDVPQGPKARRGQRGDHPLKQFSRSMRDFRGGISDLKTVAERLGRTGSSPRSGPASVGRSREAASVSSPERPVGRGPLSAMNYDIPRTPRFRGISPHMPAARQPSRPHLSTSRPTPIHTQEDREAARHLVEGYQGTFDDLPRAARVAMIARAGEVLKEEGRRHRLVESLVGAIQAGRHEVAANFNPKKLERVLSQLLGGRQNALRTLWTPEVSRMVNTYQFERDRERERLQDVERTLPEGSTRKSDPPELPLPTTQTMGSSVASPSVPQGRRSTEQTVSNLFKRNDLLHLRGQSEQRRQQLMRERSMPVSPVAQGRSEMALPEAKAPARRGPGSNPQIGETSRSGDRRKLEGTLKLYNMNGDIMGEARLDGEDSNG